MSPEDRELEVEAIDRLELYKLTDSDLLAIDTIDTFEPLACTDNPFPKDHKATFTWNRITERIREKQLRDQILAELSNIILEE